MGARQTLRAHIANLRRKIERADGERLVHTDTGSATAWRRDRDDSDADVGRDITGVSAFT
ncbi:MAG: hypothetical protein ACXVH1_24820 [Solirubrobacteraceae bacterium]